MAEVREAKRRQLKMAMVALGREDVETLRVAIEAAKVVGLEREDVQPALELLAKLEAESLPLTFTDISRSETEALILTEVRDEAVALLARCMGFKLEDCAPQPGAAYGGGGSEDAPRPKTQTRAAAEVLSEFHYQNLVFCQKHKFCAEKASTFLSIMKALHSRAVAQGRLQEPEARALLEDLVDRHSRQLPPYCVGVFSCEEANAVKEYASRAFFRHYTMYLFMYSQRHDLCVEVVERVAEKAQSNFIEQKAPLEEEREHLYRTMEAQVAEQAAMAAAAAAAFETDSETAAQVQAAIEDTLEAHLKGVEERYPLPGPAAEA